MGKARKRSRLSRHCTGYPYNPVRVSAAHADNNSLRGHDMSGLFAGEAQSLRSADFAWHLCCCLMCPRTTTSARVSVFLTDLALCGSKLRDPAAGHCCGTLQCNLDCQKHIVCSLFTSFTEAATCQCWASFCLLTAAKTHSQAGSQAVMHRIHTAIDYLRLEAEQPHFTPACSVSPLFPAAGEPEQGAGARAAAY